MAVRSGGKVQTETEFRPDHRQGWDCESRVRVYGRHADRELGVYAAPFWDVACQRCRSCRRRRAWHFNRTFAEVARTSGGYSVALTLTLPPRLRPTPAEGLDNLYRAFDLFLKRLRHNPKAGWSARVRVLESRKKRGEAPFPHFHVAFFRWRYVPLIELKGLWCSVIRDEFGVVVPLGQGVHVGRAVGAQETGRLGRYIVKEMATYLTKEERPTWLPARRRRWSKTPGLRVFMHGRHWGADRHAGHSPGQPPEPSYAREGSVAPGAPEAGFGLRGGARRREEQGSLFSGP